VYCDVVTEPPRPDRAARRGRPSRAAQRRREVVDAFVDLLAERGLDAVTLDDVAHTSGVSRSLMRHHVGNRQDLIRVTVDQLVEDHRCRIDSALGDTPDADEVIAHLFGASWSSSESSQDRALEVLLQQAVRDVAARDAVRSAYEQLIDLVSDAILRSRPGLGPGSVRDRALSVVALADHNVVMVQLGFGADVTDALRTSARSLVRAR